MDWKIQIIQRGVKARLPFGDLIRRIKRRFAGYQPDQSNIDSTFSDIIHLKAALESCGGSFQGATILELGSGWFPIFPLIMMVAGAKTVYLSDTKQRTDFGTFETARSIVFKHLEELSKPLALAANAREILLALRMSDFPCLTPLRLESVRNDSLDLIVSRAVLEHIPPLELETLLSGLKPKLKTTGLMAHAIDNSDHFEHGDKSISRVNFLTWSSRKHKFICWLSGDGENRLRHHQYADLFARAGYYTIMDRKIICNRTLHIVPNIRMVQPYADMTAEQISTLTSYYVAALGPLLNKDSA